MTWDLIVKFIHSMMVLFFVIAPFSRNCEWIVLHSLLVPFLFLHWLTNNDTCALTEIEKLLSNKTENTDTFIGSIVSPIFKLSSNDTKIMT